MFGLKHFGWIFGRLVVLFTTITLTRDVELTFVLDETTHEEQSLRIAVDESKYVTTNLVEKSFRIVADESKDVITNQEQSLRITTTYELSNNSWCNSVSTARSNLDPSLLISYPCEGMPHVTSAIVCYLTAGVAEGLKVIKSI